MLEREWLLVPVSHEASAAERMCWKLEASSCRAHVLEAWGSGSAGSRACGL